MKKTVLLWALAAAAGLGPPLFYFALLQKPAWLAAWSVHVSAPWRRAAGALAARLPFSAAEACYTLFFVLLAVFLVRSGLVLARGPHRAALAARRAAALAVAGSLVFSMYSLLWSVEYRMSTFAARAGLPEGGVRAEDLVRVTLLFAARASGTAGQLPRDEAGHAVLEKEALFAKAAALYGPAEQAYPALGSTAARPKPMAYSGVMSAIGFTGVFFPLTGEPNINVAQPAALVPATIAHELAHAHGVILEDEADFMAVRAATASGLPEYEYSGWLLGLVHLSNAVGGEAWAQIYPRLDPRVRQDLEDNNAYWARFREQAVTQAATEAATAVYDAYLKANDQALGMQSYGACVDLLVAEFAAEAAAHRQGG